MDDGFNPYGLHAIHIPLALVKYDGATETRNSLSWGAKVFYGRLALFLGKPKADSFCNPNLETMAAAMETSSDTIGRWLAELIDHGFIKRTRRGRGPAECVFLRHPCLSPEHDPDSVDLRNQTNRSKSADLRNQSDADATRSQSVRTETPTPQSGALDSATLPVQFRNSAAPTPQPCGFPNKEEKIQEDIQENIQENTTDDSRDSHNHSAKSPESSPDAFRRRSKAGQGDPEAQRAPEPEKQPRQYTAQDRRLLAVTMTRHIG
jgi:Helix-turn-helix domain